MRFLLRYFSLLWLFQGICKVVLVPGLKFWFCRDQNFQAGTDIFFAPETRFSFRYLLYFCDQRFKKQQFSLQSWHRFQKSEFSDKLSTFLTIIHFLTDIEFRPGLRLNKNFDWDQKKWLCRSLVLSLILLLSRVESVDYCRTSCIIRFDLVVFLFNAGPGFNLQWRSSSKTLSKLVLRSIMYLRCNSLWKNVFRRLS